ncbi:VIR protein [Plasmodium vivax]|uniref:VIR protein n=1 Tax=Plasmodium vivax TaxID=5855 RepID=A0A1G4E380_PLAVI|nr:VIR protein [Plasmodium vivax]
MTDILGDDKLGFLQTKYYYKKLDNGLKICNDAKFYNKAKLELSKNSELQGVSEDILNAMCYVYTKSSSENFYKDICKFLYYWLGNVLLNNLNLKDLYSEIILKLFESLNDGISGKICELPYINIDKDDFKNIKSFFDYSEDYRTYKTQISDSSMLCNDDYKSYLDTHVRMYNSMHKYCKLEVHGNRYCKEFDQFFHASDHYDLSRLSCTLKPKVQELVEDHEEARKHAQEQKQFETPEHDNLHVEKGREESPRAVRLSSSASFSDTNIPEIRSISPTQDGSSSSITSKSITGAASVAGILVPSYLMYNYTYAGTWINKVLGRKTRTNFNPYTDQYLMANFSGPENFNSERSRYNIAYSPE